MAPAAQSASISTRLAASRMSSVLGLKARPQSAKVRPARSPKCRAIFSKITSFWASLRSSTACSTRGSKPTSRAAWISAFTSLGKHEPP